MQFKAAIAAAGLLSASVLCSCGSPTPPRRAAVVHVRTTTSTTTTTTTTAPPPSTTTSTTIAQIAVPNVIGMKIAPAKFYLATAGFRAWPMNAACTKGNLPSQSVVTSLSVPGNAHLKTNTVPLAPGQLRPKGSYVGINWSGCYPNGATTPPVTGLTFGAAVTALHAAGLTWACSSTTPTTTTSTTAGTTTSAASSSAPPVGATSVYAAALQRNHSSHALTPASVQSQDPAPGTPLPPGTPVTFTMQRCPFTH